MRFEDEEIQNLLRIVKRDLKDSQSKDLSNDWRFAIAYNAALQAATAALPAAGYRASALFRNLSLVLVRDSPILE